MADMRNTEGGTGTATLERPQAQVIPPPQPEQQEPTPQGPQRKTSDERKAALATATTNLIAEGMRVESQSDYQAVLVKGKKVNHVLHGILTLLTVGTWAIVWIPLGIWGGEHRKVVAVDDWGNVSVSDLGRR